MDRILALLLVLGLVPALFPRRRQALIAAGVYAALVLVSLIWAHVNLDSMTRGEGPAFFALMLTLGAIQALLFGSLLLRAMSFWLAGRLPVASRTRTALCLLAVFASAVVLAGLLHHAGLAGRNLVGVASVLFAPLAWLAASLLLLPAASFRAESSAAAP